MLLLRYVNEEGGNVDRERNILVAEDDDDINRLLCDIIRKNGWGAQPAYSGTEAMLYIDRGGWNLILLDLMMPGMPGEEILDRVAGSSGTPVIVISAKGARETRISALHDGADDFIDKPFDVDEVEARIESVLRRYERSGERVPKMLTHKDIVLNPDTKAVEVAGRPITLTAREYMILVTLMSRPDKVFSKENIFESVWGEPFHGDENTVNVHMSNLRSKLAEANPDGAYIDTVWGMGYRMKS
ncbi:MAG TPA: response regulator transcription factor [Candidatus Salinicoccus stercoripullorum]|uniref:Response regulator SaeR n=1 Tax=Candidatus Salinicoccus stercoripullorum TaxID=2838756 RepID=A0A9D1QHQ9_9STAP|nr:response regulator transcription factor [Candidatus Salinicoccus stercoripullorum]